MVPVKLFSLNGRSDSYDDFIVIINIATGNALLPDAIIIWIIIYSFSNKILNNPYFLRKCENLSMTDSHLLESFYLGLLS